MVRVTDIPPRVSKSDSHDFNESMVIVSRERFHRREVKDVEVRESGQQVQCKQYRHALTVWGDLPHHHISEGGVDGSDECGGVVFHIVK